MIHPWVPERADAPPPRKKRMHVTLRAMVGYTVLAVGVVTGWAAIDGIAPTWPGLLVGAALLVVSAPLAFSPPRGVPALYAHAPEAPEQAREHSIAATAVVEHRTVERSRPGRARDVTWRLLIAAPDGRRYRTTSAQFLLPGTPPAHERGDVVAVRVHPGQRGVVVIVGENPPGPPPETPRRPVPVYSGVPRHTRGTLVSELAAGLLIVGAMVVGLFVAFTVLALAHIVAGSDPFPPS